MALLVDDPALTRNKFISSRNAILDYSLIELQAVSESARSFDCGACFQYGNVRTPSALLDTDVAAEKILNPPEWSVRRIGQSVRPAESPNQSVVQAVGLRFNPFFQIFGFPLG